MELGNAELGDAVLHKTGGRGTLFRPRQTCQTPLETTKRKRDYISTDVADYKVPGIDHQSRHALDNAVTISARTAAIAVSQCYR